jgi:hypothetical protein
MSWVMWLTHRRSKELSWGGWDAALLNPICLAPPAAGVGERTAVMSGAGCFLWMFLLNKNPRIPGDATQASQPPVLHKPLTTVLQAVHVPEVPLGSGFSTDSCPSRFLKIKHLAIFTHPGRGLSCLHFFFLFLLWTSHTRVLRWFDHITHTWTFSHPHYTFSLTSSLYFYAPWWL